MRQQLVLLVLVLIDTGILICMPYLSLLLRFDGNIPGMWVDIYHLNLLYQVVVGLVVFAFFRLYKRLWQYASIHELLAIVGAVTISTCFAFAGAWSGIVPMLPRSVYLLSWALTILAVGASRLALRVYYYLRTKQYSRTCDHTLIVGAGDAGVMLARELSQRYYESKKLIGFIDDDFTKKGKLLVGVKVLGNRADLSAIIEKFEVKEVIIAMPTAPGSVVREVMTICQQVGCMVKTLPGLYELIDGDVTVSQLRSISVEDLLRRDPIRLETDAIQRYICGKRVLVTGAGGSIGSEICRQLARQHPSEIVLLGKGENSIYDIERELRLAFPTLKTVPVIADVRDATRVEQVFTLFTPQVVFHAAAHKHVPLMEIQPAEAIRNNVFGTRTVAETSDRHGVETFIMISTDKAVNPTSVMGATKRMAELVVQELSQRSKTVFAAVRFGNVLGSRGSVLPLFRKQIAMGGPVTVTDPEMKRYFMTIPEASQLVLQAGAQATGGEVFVLDMGEPVKIVDLARDVIRLSGLEPDRDIAISFCGLRPGEKLFEELLTAEEGTRSTRHEKIFIANLRQVNYDKLEQVLVQMQNEVDPDMVVSLLKAVIPTYHPNRYGDKK